MAKTDYADFLRDPDQPARRAELEAFFGPNAHKFLPVYDRLRADFARTGKPGFSLRGGGFSFPALLCGPCWFLYRKMWAIGAIVIAGAVALAFLPVSGGAGIGISIALVAAVAGTVSAWRNRVALATGFAVAPADQLEGGGGDVVIALITMTSFIPTGWDPSPTKILMLWMIAFYLARGLTLMAEQLFAAPDGNGWRIANPVCATLGAAALLFASTCR